jgi:hypothetical protein
VRDLHGRCCRYSLRGRVHPLDGNFLASSRPAIVRHAMIDRAFPIYWVFHAAL